VDITHGDNEVMLFTNTGKVIRFDETDVRAVGRTARGVRGIKLKEGQQVISLVVPKPDMAILTATENGYGKRTVLDDYRSTGRGGQGVISIQVSERNGKVVGADQVMPTDEVLLISDKGTLVRIRAADISLVGRNTQGVRLIRLHPDEHLIGMTAVADLEGVAPDLAASLEPFTASLESEEEDEDSTIASEPSLEPEEYNDQQD
jgi:DNA gyrase subunit A